MFLLIFQKISFGFQMKFNKRHSKNQMLFDNIFSFHNIPPNNSYQHNHQMNLEFLQF